MHQPPARRAVSDRARKLETVSTVRSPWRAPSSTSSSSEDGLAEYADLLAESDRLRYLSPILHREMISELRWPPRDSIETGIDVRTLELSPGDLAKLDVARRADVMADLASWDGGRALGTVTRDRVRSSSARWPWSPCRVPARRRMWPPGWPCNACGWRPRRTLSRCSRSRRSASSRWTTRISKAWCQPPTSPGCTSLAGRLRSLASMADDEVLGLVLRLSHAGRASTRSLRIPLSTVLLGGPAPVDPQTQPGGTFER